jgi:PAS domain S-box-containing protein
MDYQAIFNQSPALMVLLDTKFNILSVSDAFLNTSKTSREKVIGQYLFDVFPDNPDEHNFEGGNIIRASLNSVLKNKIPDTLPILKYDIPNLEGGFIKKYWKICHSPVFDEFNEVKYIMQVAEDVTENETLTQQLAQEKQELKQVEDSEKRYNMLLMKSPFGFAVFKGKNMVISLANNSIKDFWGKGEDVEGKALFDLIPELKESDFPKLINDVYTTGNPFYGDELLAPIIRNGKLEDAYFNFIYQPYYEVDETISGVTIIAYEVTPQAILKKALADQREAEQKALKSIAESNKRYYTMLMESPFAFSIMIGKDMVVTLANDLMKEFWGKGEDVEGKTLLEILPEIKDQPFPEMIEKVYTTGIPVYANEILGKLTCNGQLNHKYFNVVFQPYYEADSSISGVTQIAYDVTETVLARKRIEESEAFSSSILNASPDCIKILDTEGRLQYMNENGICLLEIDDFSKYKNLFWWEMWEDHNQELIKNAILKASNGEKVQFQALGLSVKGSYKWWDIIILPMLNHEHKNVDRLLCVSRDITAYKEVALKVQEVEHRYQQMIYSSPSLILILSGADLIISVANDSMLEVLGKGKDIVNQPLLKVIPEIIEQGLGDLLLKVYTTGKPEYGYELPIYLIRNGEKELFHFTYVYQAQRNLKGEIDGVAMIAQEVTPQALLNKKIKAREEQFRLLVQQAPVAICVLRGKDYVIETINEQMLEMWDRTIQDAIQRPAFDVLPEFRDQGLKELLDNVALTGERFVAQELPLSIWRNGTFENIFVKFVYEPLHDADGNISGVMALAHEITELVIARKKMEVQTALFEDMLMTAPGYVCTLTGPDHVYELVNEQYQKLFEKRQIKGKPIMVALPELEGQGFDKLLDKVYTTGEPYVGIDIPIKLARDNNLVPELFYFNFSYQPMYNEFEEIYSILVFGYEVTEQVLAKKRIEESELHFRQLADLMPAKISHADKEGNVLYFNKHWLDFTGLNFEELENLGYYNILHPDELGEFQAKFQKASETKTILEMEMRFLDKKGDYKWHLNLASPVLDENDEIKMWVGSTTEIHEQVEQKSILKNAVRERTIDLERANTLLIFQNEEKEKRAEELNIVIRELAFQNEEKEKKSVELIKLSKDLSAKQQELLNANELLIKQDEKVSIINHELSLLNQELERRVTNRTKALADSETRFRNMMETIPQISWTNTVNGEFTFYNQRWYDYTGLNKKETKELGPKSIIHPDDMQTARDEYQSILKKGNGGEFQIRGKQEDGNYRWHLIRLMPIKNDGEKLAQLWVGTATDIQELRVLQQQKDDFISIASHELKTPITSLKASLQVMNKLKDNPSPALFANLITRASSSLDKVTLLIDNLLNTSRANEGQIHLSKKLFVISEIVEDCCHHIRDEGTYTIKTVGDLDLKVYADAMRVDQIIINFVNNAIKYAPKSKEVIIKIEKLEGFAKVSVVDKGPGIDPEKTRHLFDRYYRVDSSGSQYSGLGLGLYISAEIIKKHKGQIGVDSELGKGSTFWFTLPL